jgi:hypothetical protein
VSSPYDWSRFRRRHLEPGHERQAIPHYIDPEEEPTVRVPAEPDAVTISRRPATRSAAELDAELAQHAGEGR